MEIGVGSSNTPKIIGTIFGRDLDPLGEPVEVILKLGGQNVVRGDGSRLRERKRRLQRWTAGNVLTEKVVVMVIEARNIEKELLGDELAQAQFVSVEFLRRKVPIAVEAGVIEQSFESSQPAGEIEVLLRIGW